MERRWEVSGEEMGGRWEGGKKEVGMRWEVVVILLFPFSERIPMPKALKFISLNKAAYIRGEQSTPNSRFCFK